MRKTAGFLLVLLLATLAIITTSSGDETDSSHVAHLTADYGPQLELCIDCHVVPYTGVFIDGRTLADTDICDTCHSPGGAYDGVNGPYIGAKTNWVSGVYDGSALQHSKEKWCVGCHDEEPATSKADVVDRQACIDDPECAVAPNVIGDDVDYGYYKTGHGRGYGTDQPAVSCLECHDPTGIHVDGEARTYTAVDNNYQTGYRLKSVNGYEPLDVPRSGFAFTAEQFRLCFSCHESAPFLDRYNTDTNFRSDVNDSCVVDLYQPVNRHWYHLQAWTFLMNKWDSDWDGATADSTPSCTACHNVHGPRNAPAMIRTGELIGRAYSLNLEYYVNPCPDTTRLLTDETLDSTGGQNKFLGAARGSVISNGVCNMCHNEVDPYWRTPKVIAIDYTTQEDEYKDCTTCHVPDEPSQCNGALDPDNPEIDCEACHGHDEGYEYAEGESGPLYSSGIGSDLETPASPSHSTHTENDEDDLRGLNLACATCHNMNSYNDFYDEDNQKVLFSDDGNDIDSTTVCNPCHSPGGAYDGVNNDVNGSIGAKANWDDGVYDGSSLKTDKEKWCVGCHDDAPSVVNGVSALNIAGDNANYGYYKTGHGKHNNEQAISCLSCHDTTFIHVDGEARTYAADDNNYQAGYRLKSVNGLAPMVVPRIWDRWQPSDINAGQFRLCFSCHDSAPFLSSDNTDTNFRSDVNDSCETLDPPANSHWYHLQPIGNFNLTWDSDLDGANDPTKDMDKNTADSMPSCTACHNVHGPKLKDGATHAPAMIRTGELIGRSSSLNLDYFTNSCPDKTLSVTNELFDETNGNSTGGQMISQGGGQGSVNKNGVCQMCHQEEEPYWREARDIVGCESGNCHTNPSHATHLTADYGPHISCADCHNTDENNYSRFFDGEDLANTIVCDPCHSPGGTYNGVDHSVYGAKDNWDDGVYDGSALLANKEKWCATCHDEEPSVIDGVTAPNIAGDEDNSDGEGIYGGWGYYKTGHGLPGDEPYASKGGFIEPPLEPGVSRAVECDSCHDFSTAHIDGEPRTFDDGDSGDTLPSVYREGYRLKLVNGGEPMQIPWKPGTVPNEPDTYRLCAECHVTTPFTTTSTSETNLITNTLNRHETHLRMNVAWYSPDWDFTVKTSRFNCVVCHNVHGSTQLAMVRDGKLIGREPGLVMWYYNEDTVVVNDSNTEPPDPEDTPLAASDGTIWRGQTSINLCSHCHNNSNTIKAPRDLFQDVSVAPTLDWTGENGYVSDGANPDSGASGSSFTFRVKYTDLNNDGPVTPDGYIHLLIDTDCDGSADLDSPYTMEESDSGDEKYPDGKIYSKSLILTGTGNSSICYKFEARDETGLDATGSPTNWSTILLLNNAPVLSWTGEDYYENDGVNPDTGGNGASFTFRVKYTDADECPPTADDIQVWVDDNDNVSYQPDEKFNMTAVDGGDLDCSDGKLYTYSANLSYLGDGNINYRFYATDGTDAATGDPAADSTVTVLITANTPPFLEWWDGTCVTEGVKPPYGATGADFEFHVKYTDPDGCPSAADAVQVTIDTVGTYDMTGDAGDTDCTDGRLYSVSKNDLTAGTYNYYFSATDDGGEPAYGDESEYDDPTNTGTYEVEVVDARGVRDGTGDSGPLWYNSIQDAINASLSDTNKMTLVYEGTYTERLNLANGFYTYDNSTVRSVCGPDETIIKYDGNEVVYLQNTTGIVIDGFGITSVSIDGSLTGVRSTSGSATINNCKIYGHHNTDRGGALVAGNDTSIFTVTNSEIYGNEADEDGGAVNLNAGIGHSFTNTIIRDNTAGDTGGAMFIQNCSATFTDVIIKDNTAAGSGGAIYSNNGDADFTRCTITGNTSTSGSGGFMVLGNGGEDVNLTNCIVANNQAVSGGVSFVNGAAFTAQNSTFAYNQATAGEGGVLWHQNATSIFKNSILWGNSASSGGHNVYFNGGSMTISDSIIASGSDGVYTNAPYFKTSGAAYTLTVEGYMSEGDPMFVDAAADNYHIQDISPAVDNGNATDAPGDDIDGDSRPQGIAHDIGADEYLTGLNNTPVLSWTGEPNYASDGIDPDSGNGEETNFVFRVDYTDADDNPPVLIQVWIDEDDSGTYSADEKFTMIGVDSGDTDYTDSKRYTLSRVLNYYGDGTLKFRFYAMDGGAEASGDPTAEQSVSLTNSIPVLSWTGEAKYNNDGVDPDGGEGGSLFTFRVKYTDGDNVAPNPLQVWVDTDNSGVYDAHEKYTMTQDDDDGDSLYSNGEKFTIDLPIPYIGDGAITYRFYGSDGADAATGIPVTDIAMTITAPLPGNNVPVLSWKTDANCLSEGVRPPVGADGVDFEFKVIYTDIDPDQCAADILLLIDEDDSGTYETEEKYILTGDAGDTDCTDGRLYETTLNLVYTGELNYSFYATDSFEAAVGTPVSDSTVTVLDALKVRPTGGTGWYSTIQSAEAVSTDPSTILVYPEADFTAATYAENIDARTVNLTMRSTCGPDLTIIDGTSAVLLRADNQVFDGFSVTGAGVGIYVNPGPDNVTIKNNKIYGNTTGIDVNIGFNTHIENNEIYNNSMGIRANAGSTVDITNCDIHDNKLSGWGAGIYLNGGVHTITDSVIRDNSNTGDGGGIAFNAVGAGTTVTNTTIGNNQAVGRGGGMFITGDSQVTFDRCTISGNRSSSLGGGMYSMIGATLPVFRNSIIAGNQASSGGFAYIHSGTAEFYNVTFADNHATNIGGVFRTCGISDRIIIRNSIFWGNTGDGGGNIASRTGCSAGGILLDVSYSDVDESQVGGDSLFFNNINPAEDPLFAGNDNYHILTGSPVIDQAHADYAPADDIDGETRPQGLADDMGADEYYVPVDSTTAGIGTAKAGVAGIASITVSMPYIYDANSNSTYTVDYKLSSDHTSVWTNWVTEAANTASPYTTTITGLIAGETYDVRMTYNDADGVSGKVQRAVSSIDLTPQVNLTTASQSVAEDVGTVTVTATLSWISGSDVTVPFTVSGTAEGGGTDHDLADGNIIITAGNLTGTTDFTVTDDDLVESSETVIVTMGTPVNANADVFFVVHTVTITDNEPQPSVTFTSAVQATVDESGTATITAELSALSSFDVEVPFTTGAGTATGGSIDYSITDSPVIITAGTTTVDITITIAADSLDEDDETVIVDMGTPTNATQGATTTHTLTITDDDAEPSVTFTSAAQATGDESVTDYNITAQLSGASGKDVTVPFTVNVTSTATGGGTDYSINPSPIIITAGNTTADITVTIADDTDIEGDETVIVDMDSPTNATQVAPTTHTVTITDDEAPPVVDFSTASLSVAEDVGTVTVTAELEVISTLDVTVPFTVSGTAEGSGTDHDLADGNITITAGQLTGTKDFTLADDSLDEPDETVIITMGTPVNGTAGTTVLHTVTITDNDTAPSVEFTLPSQATAGESGTATITAELSAVSGKDVTVPFTVDGLSTATGGGTDYSITPSPVTITAGTTTADIIVTIVIDFDIEDDETVIVDMGSPINATQGATLTHTLTITDDDFAGGTIRTVCGSGGASYTTIQEAIGVATDGDRVEVCAGTYSENINFDGKDITIQSTDGADTTIIEGDGSNAAVVTFSNGETSSAVLDGFTINNQATDCSTRGAYISNSAAPTISNSIFEGNTSNCNYHGAAIYINGGAATIDSTTFGSSGLHNTEDFGGAIYATSLSDALTITNSAFNYNDGDFGGAIYLTGNSQTTSITNTTFSNNTVTQHGAAIYSNGSPLTISGGSITSNTSTQDGAGIYLTGASATLTISDSASISSNNGRMGGAIYANGTGAISISNATIDSNTGSTYGGGIYMLNTTGASTITNTSISGNQSTGLAAGLYFGSSATTSLTLTNCNVDNNTNTNTGSFDGGGMYLSGANVTVNVTGGTVNGNTTRSGGGIQAVNGVDLVVSGTTINSNDADASGGGISIVGTIDYTSTLDISKCIVSGNVADDSGAGIYVGGYTTATITNCTITGNLIELNFDGGGVYDGGTTTIYSSTIAGNYAKRFGGGLRSSANTIVENSIIWGNDSGTSGPQITGTPSSITYTDVDGGGFAGTGNIDADPVFVNEQASTSTTPTTTGDFHIDSLVSPVVDTADATNSPPDDIDGDSRYLGSADDMGSDEYEPPAAAVPTLDWTGETNYTVDGIDPQSAAGGSDFVFRVEYTDVNNDTPTTIQVWVDANDDGDYLDANEKENMTETDAGDTNKTDGKLYAKTLAISIAGDNTLNYRFYAADGTGDATGTPTSDSTLTVTNNAPTLAWTGETNYSIDGVDPNTGGDGSNFIFRIDYTDADNTVPSSIQVWIDRNDDGDYLDANEKEDMTATDGDDTTYTDGKRYTKTLTLSSAGDNSLIYRFYSSDGTADATGTPTSNNAVTVGGSNNAPALAWTGETDYVSDGVDPDSGPGGSNFIFRINYTDDDDEAPTSIQVWIDRNDDGDYLDVNEKEDMTGTDGGDTTYTDGKLYAVTLTVSYDGEGSLPFLFYATDGTDTATGTPTSSSTLTVTDPLEVPGEYATIQAAIDAASSGDTVMVASSGSPYSENIDFLGKNITVRSVSGAGSTTIQGLTTGTNLPVVTFDTSEGSGAVLDGFTIDNQASGTISRGIYISGATPTIQNCIIEGNVPVNSTGGGSGIYINDSAPTISNTIIRKNTAINRYGAGIYITGTAGGATITDGSVIGGDSSADENKSTSGGGIYMTGSTAGSLTITNSTIKYNDAVQGSGLYLNAITQTTNITGSTISYNIANNGHGGGIFVNSSPLSITDSYVDYNSTPTYKFGGGIYVQGTGSTVSIDNTTFNNNTTGSGGGIYMTGSTHATPLTITGGEISSNTTVAGGGIWLQSTTNTSTITGMTISSNTTSNGHGGGIYATSPLTVTGSTIEGNSTSSSKEGGGIYANSTLNVTKTLIRGNRALYGAGIRYSTGTATITNSTITGNGADWQAYAKGGGISIASGTVNIYNSTISGNYSTDDGGGLHGTATVKNSIIWGNTSGDANYHNLSTTVTAEYSNIGEPEYPGGTGNINEDPDFVDYQYATNGTRTTAGDFHLCKAEGDPTGCGAGSASPSIDTAGTNNLPSDDIDGGTRPYDVPSMGNDGSNYYDMGSDEYGVAAP